MFKLKKLKILYLIIYVSSLPSGCFVGKITLGDGNIPYKGCKGKMKGGIG